MVLVKTLLLKSQRQVEWLKLSLYQMKPSQGTFLVLVAAAVGLATGLGAIVFRGLIEAIHELAFNQGKQFFAFLGSFYVIIIPAIGGLVVGPLVYCFAREAKGHGVPEVIEAVALRGGRIRPVVVVIKSLASSICIATGGSVGREGPIVQIGSAIGSTLAQVLNLSQERVRALVACGAAGGIAATFNAPIAGVIFTLEVILGGLNTEYFSLVVISSVTASTVGRAVFGNVPAFEVPLYSLNSPWELPLYALLGVFAAFIGTGFILCLYKLEDFFDAWNFSELLKPAAGGIFIGFLGLFVPQIFGVGYEAIEQALRSEFSVLLLLALLFVKMLATSITIGSGGSGGVFAPALFLGAMFGGYFGHVVNSLFPAIAVVPGAYSLVGMAAVFAATARAPITAIIILFEMTGDYNIILPLMLCTVISTSLASRMLRDSIYSMKLARKGIMIEQGRDLDIIQTVRVEEAMTTEVHTVPSSMHLTALARVFKRTHHHGFPVLNDNDELYGVISIGDLERALSTLDFDGLSAGDIATKDYISVYPDEPMSVAIEKMGPLDLSRLPVVDRQNPRKLVGIIRRGDLLKAYNVAALRRAESQHRLQRRWTKQEAQEVSKEGIVDK